MHFVGRNEHLKSFIHSFMSEQLDTRNQPWLRSITRDNPYSICFVCLGNICRSPTAEGVLQHQVNQEGLSAYFFIDSAGTGSWHEGEPANSKSRDVARRHGVELHSRARRFTASDLSRFDLIMTMDRSNFDNVLSLDSDGQHRYKVLMLREFDDEPASEEVPDPYYGGAQGFELVYDVVERSCRNLLEHLRPFIHQ